MLGWTFTAWLVVVIIPAMITGFSIIYYMMGEKKQGEEDEA
ncbi:hypothetical protein [Alkalibacillus salilacus]|uniref:General stress protein CsbA n=1 Tax=Alkalibacillus salilacus TaxID=284582 RepID=A0ABT9VHZ4_9BACI|nr:hypothetical protein [Alkalibacillus salilacus]MDQ0160455.1 general stress protein CsbA [Alkalibacillus salilacus]